MNTNWGKISIRTALTDQIDLIIKKQKQKSSFIPGQADNPTQFVDIAVKEKIQKELESK